MTDYRHVEAKLQQLIDVAAANDAHVAAPPLRQRRR